MPTYFSEIAITGDSPQEFIEIAVPTGTDTSGYSVVHYMGDGTIYQTYSFGTVESTTAGHDVYTIDDSDPDVPVVTADTDPMGNIYPDDAFALVDDTGTVIQFVSFYGNNVTATQGAANGMTSTEIGTPAQGESLQSDDGGSSYYTQSSPNRNSIPCFEASTLILTKAGYRRAETLRLGDKIKTVDNGDQPIRWIRRYRADLTGLELAKQPVRISAGALGQNCPHREITVSPQHRVVIGLPQQLANAGHRAMLAPAKALTNLPGIRHLKGTSKVSYIHFAFDQHEVVWANGSQVEALFLSETVLSGMPRLQRDGLRMAARAHQKFKGNKRPFLRVAEARRLSNAVVEPAI
jgi:hypothetical protein